MFWCPSQWSENSLFVANVQFFKLSFFKKCLFLQNDKPSKFPLFSRVVRIFIGKQNQ